MPWDANANPHPWIEKGRIWVGKREASHPSLGMIEASPIQYVVTAQRDLLNAKLVGQHVVFSSHAADGIRQNQT